MKRSYLVLMFCLLAGIFLADEADAQRRRYKRPPSKEYKITHYRGGRVNDLRSEAKNFYVGFSVNAMNYFGDISPAPKKLSTDIGFTRAGFGITAGKKFHPNASIRAGFNIGKIRADDAETADPTEENSLGRFQRNLHFENTIKEFSLGLELDLFPNYGGINSRFPINPYIFIGGAIFAHDPKAVVPETDLLGNPFDNAGEKVSLRDLGTEGQNTGIDSLPGKYGKVQFAIPIGVGVKVRILGNLDANLEFGLRQLFFDYLDDVSGRYPDLGSLDSELARALVDRGTETTSALSGTVRDTNFYSVSSFRASDGVTYAKGINYAPGGVRGGSKDNDFYLVTALRLVYYIQSGGSTRGKFR